MAKETMIVFVYDTECLKEEADDPVNAVLYFHPSWVSDTQKVALCGQLMGTSYFLKDCFFKPRILALQNGKFILKEFGRFILAVGTDRNISDYLLEHRAELLASLVRLFHRDLQTIYDQFPLSGQYKNLAEKLYHIFETYLPILQQKGSIFQNIPKLRLPKTASDIFLDAIQTLQCCQQTKGVLGGAILYHNKVVATQLSDQITKQLVLTDPLHIRTPAEQITNTLDFHIPNGVQMIVVYVETEQYRKMAADANRAQNLQTQQLLSQNLPFQYSKRKMKRDKSLIFTNIPEESTTVDKDQVDEGTAETTGSEPAAASMTTTPSSILSRPKSLTRPSHLPLRFKNMTTREVPESGIASINFDENDSFPEFIGRTSVCSTPMAENKVLQVGNIMSICANPESDPKTPAQPNNNRRNSLKIDFEKFFQNFITNPNKMERRNSFTDLQDSFKKFSKKFSLKSSKSNGQKTDVNRNGSSSEMSDFIENDDDDNDDVPSSGSDNSDGLSKAPRTITDPTYPVFNTNGQPISRSLFQEFIERYYKLWDGDSKEDAEIAKLIEEFKEFDNELKKLNETLTKDSTTNPTAAFKADSNLNIEEIAEVAEAVEMPKAKTPLDKKSLSLPLKPLADATPSESNAPALPFGGGASQRKQPGAIPLTPLMAKLSVLALNEERTSGFCSWDVTPGGVEIQTPLDGAKVFRRRSSSLKCEEAVDAMATLSGNQATASADGMQRLELYVCGQQNMTLLLLMEQGSGSDQKIVQGLFDVCVSKFPHMESHLNQTLNVNVEGDKSEGGYSFVCIDSKWDALQRNGPWNPVELNTLETIHRDLQTNGNITDVILRANDTVFYGYKCGRTEFFYKEPVHQATGIPPPSDPMGNVAMRAKTRLERDHSYVLL